MTLAWRRSVRVQLFGEWSLTSSWSLLVPGQVTPWVVGFISQRRPFLLIHALFALADSDVEIIHAIYVTIFTDMIHFIQEDWEMLLSSIHDGTIPDVEHIDHFRAYLQVSTTHLPSRTKFEDSRITCMQIRSGRKSFGT